MQLTFRRLAAGLVVLCLHSFAGAEVPAATAETLMRKSGMWAQLGDLSRPIKAGFAQPPFGSLVSPEDMERLQQRTEDAFAADRLRATALQILARDVTPAQAKDVLRWYDSPTGQQMARLEEVTSAQFGEQSFATGNSMLGKASAQRVRLLNQIVKATQADEVMTTAQLHSANATIQGLSSVLPPTATPYLHELLKSMESNRPMMVASSWGLVLSQCALTYQSASDQALTKYVKFLSSRSGAALMVIVNDAFDKSMAAAAKRLGQGVPKVADVTDV